MRLDLDLDGVGVDRHVLRDHCGELGAQLLQASAFEAAAIVREHEVQAALGNVTARLAAEEILDASPHGSAPHAGVADRPSARPRRVKKPTLSSSTSCPASFFAMRMSSL